MADATVPAASETLAWESAQKTRAGLLALVAGNLTLFGGIAASTTFSDFPKVSVLDGLRDAAGVPLGAGAGEGLRTAQLQFYDDKATKLLIVSIVLGIGSAAMAGVLGYLFRATAARNPALPRIALFGALIGPIILGVSEIALQVGIDVKASDFVDKGDFSTAAAHDALQGGVVLASQVLRQAGILLLAFSFILICLNAMRVGLLTRFMGVLGMIVGALFIIPLGANLPVVQCFWLVATGFLIMDRWPGGRPPAWTTGKAEPWPTQQQIREAREAAAGGGAPAAAKDGGRIRTSTPSLEKAAPDAPADTPAGAPHPTSKKRRNRKRR